MAFINIAQPDGHPRHVDVFITNGYVVFNTLNEHFVMDTYEARELGRMLMHAGEKLYKERER